MSSLTQGIYSQLASDSQLVHMLAKYKGNPAIFTAFPIPGDAKPPYIVSAGEVSQAPFDTKTSRGRDVIRDIKAYTAADGNPIEVEAIIERARALFHRRSLAVSGFTWVISNVTGPIAIDEPNYYGRAISLELKAQED